MRLIILASGSSGNAALIEDGGRAVLLDVGISGKETVRRILAAGVTEARIEAILVTHEHVDHIRGARVLARKLRVPVIASSGTLQAAAQTLTDVPEQIAIGRRETFSVAGLRVRAFETNHDSAEPLGFTFENRRGIRIGICTDTGMITPAALEALQGVHALGIEANHDPRMLAEGSYPPFLKRRIAGDGGHLSNGAAAEGIERVAWQGLSHVFALHLSEQNNTPDAARRALVRSLEKLPETLIETVGRNEIAGCSL